MAESYEHLVGKPVLAVGGDGETVRGLFNDERDGHPWVQSFDNIYGRWQDWESVNELSFGELTKFELRDWQYSDPRGYLLAGHAWASEIHAKGGT